MDLARIISSRQTSPLLLCQALDLRVGSESVFEVRESGYDTLSLRNLPVCMDKIHHHGASQGKNDSAGSVGHVSRRSITNREISE